MLWTKGPQPLQLSLKRGSAVVKRHDWSKRKRLDTSLVLLIVPYRVCPIKPHSNYYKGAEYSGRATALPLSLPHSSAFYSLHYISAHVFIQNRQKNVESLPSFSLSRHEGQFCDIRGGVVRGGGFQKVAYVNPLNPELNPICYLLALLAHHFLHVSRIRAKSLIFRRLMSYIYGAPILDVSRSHTTTQHSR